MRAGHVTRQRGLFRDAHGLATLSLPLHTTDFNTWYQGRHSAEKREALDTKQRLRNEPHLAVRTKHKQYAQIDAQAHSDHAFNIGINSILEVGRGRDGQPTHILLLKRGPHVPEAPNHWDFPAGLIRAGQSPADVINHRVKTELGIEPHQIRRVGPGLQPTEQDAWLALHRIDKAHNYNAIVVQRADITVTAARRTVSANIKKAKKDRNPWAPTAFRLVPRTPDAIREFVRKNDATWMPEVLRLYARELYTAGKRTLNP
jgi:ADP-ribose pyrophosphatase YjhB (NUDIX family)